MEEGFFCGGLMDAMIANRPMIRPQIVITGCGVVNPLGVNRDQFWAALRTGQTALRIEEANALAKEGGALAVQLRQQHQ